MPEPLIFKGTLSVSLIRALQSILPTTIATVAMQLLAAQMRLLPGDRYALLLGLVAVSTFLTVRPKESLTSLISSPLVVMVRIYLARWCLNLLVLTLFFAITRILDFYPLRLLFWWSVLTPVLLIAVVLPIHAWFRNILVSRENTKRVIIVGCNEASQALAAKLKLLHLRVDGAFDDRGEGRLGSQLLVPLLGKLPELPDYVRTHSVDVIFIALPMRHVQRVITLLGELRDTTASIYYVPDIFVFDLIQAGTADVLGIPVVAMCESPLNGNGGLTKRLTDVVFSAVGLLALSPILLLAAGLVAASSRGPVIFKQRRYGIDGRQIIVYKFRTMGVTEDGPTIVQATRDDKRVTLVGRFLRRTSIDELPQLVNVLEGSMSLVGPRPHAVAHNEEYRKLIPGYMVRHKVPPGITGLAQVNGCRGELSSLEDMKARVHYDLEYLRHWSWLLDMRILLRTVLIVFGDKHAY
jgi:putative colanic acid biosynthesis UDP-glucose lipid carrier transferase